MFARGPALLEERTANPLAFWKTRVFSYRDMPRSGRIDGLPGSDAVGDAYVPFRAVDGFHPDALEHPGAERFFAQVMAQKEERIARFLELVGAERPGGRALPSQLDAIGDVLAEAVQPAARAKGRDGAYRSPYYFDRSLYLHPLWVSVSVDLAMLLGDLAVERYAEYGAKWDLATRREGRDDFLAYPLVRLPDLSKPALAGLHDDEYDEDPEQVRLIERLREEIDAKPGLQDDHEEWEKVVDRVVGELGLDPDAIAVTELRPHRIIYRETMRNANLLAPFSTAQSFLVEALDLRSPDRVDGTVALSLGDCFRPDNGAAWASMDV